MPGAKDQKKPKPGAEEEEEIVTPDPNADDASGDEGEEGKGDEAGDDGIDFADAEKAKAEILKLRKENAKHRIKNKETNARLSALETRFGGVKKALGVEEEESPEEKAGKLQAQNEHLQMEVHIAQIAREYEIPKEHDKYFRFLLASKMEQLEDGDELADEDLEEVVNDVKMLANKKGGGSSGVNAKGKKPDEGVGDITVEQFANMNTGERSQLYTKNPGQYNTLFQAAKGKGLL